MSLGGLLVRAAHPNWVTHHLALLLPLVVQRWDRPLEAVKAVSLVLLMHPKFGFALGWTGIEHY
jgi:hypothetical protein